jgi:hypothetical protein
MVARGTTVAIINDLADHTIINEQLNQYLSKEYGLYVVECSHLLPRISKRGHID